MYNMETPVNLTGSELLVEVTNMEIKSFSKNEFLLLQLVFSVQR